MLLEAIKTIVFVFYILQTVFHLFPDFIILWYCMWHKIGGNGASGSEALKSCLQATYQNSSLHITSVQCE